MCCGLSASPPAIVSGSFHPFGKDISAGERKFEVEFDQEVKELILC